MTALAIVKPDHVGDLILAAPAIRFLATVAREARLFVAPACEAVAAALFPDLSRGTLALGHLAKAGGADRDDLGGAFAEIAGFRQIVCLRADEVLNRPRLKGLLRRALFVASDNRRHESATQHDHLATFYGSYDRDQFWPGATRPWPRRPQRIGICLGSGFPANRWSLLRWVELGRRLLAEGAALHLIETPREAAEVAILAHALDLPAERVIRAGGLRELLDRVGALDAVIASDGGGGHVCSLAAPVLTIAGSVPFRRFAPYGRAHRVVSLDLPCSPCLNYHPRFLNGCFSHECSYGIAAEAVVAALHMPAGPPGHHAPLTPRGHVFFGVSHA